MDKNVISLDVDQELMVFYEFEKKTATPCTMTRRPYRYFLTYFYKIIHPPYCVPFILPTSVNRFYIRFFSACITVCHILWLLLCNSIKWCIVQ